MTRKSTALLSILVYVLLIIGACAFVIPFAWMISSSLKPEHLIFRTPIKWLPRPAVWRNYYEAFTLVPFALYYKNTAIITLLGVIGELIASALAGYGFSRLKFWGRNALFLVIMGTMMLPAQVTLIPLFIIFRRFGWLNTLLPLIVPQMFGSPFNIFLMRQYFLTIPTELEDAALIDGAGALRTFYAIFLPLVKPALVTIAIFTFMANWNDFFGPLIYLNNARKFTISLGLMAFQVEQGTIWSLLMAASVTSIIPCLLIFACFQKYFVEGMALTGLKG
jgi:multiple sugar transport system permease protein